MYAQLLIDLFKYLAPFLRNVELTKPMQILYKVSCRKFHLASCHQPPHPSSVSSNLEVLNTSRKAKYLFCFVLQGTLRVLLVLLHDFPEFLCDYHYGFCDVIPPNCIQLRNLILSAFPRNMRLPDPFTPNLKVPVT